MKAPGSRPSAAGALDRVHPDIARVLLTAGQIEARVAELGRRIGEDYRGRSPVLVGVLKGSALFLADLLRRVPLDCSVDFMCAASYSGDASTGMVRLLLDLRDSPEGRDIILVEDIVDTGLTLSCLVDTLRARRPRTLEVCALLDKPQCRKVPVDLKYVGFPIANEFVVGYGLDFNEKYRNLPYVGVLRSSP